MAYPDYIQTFYKIMFAAEEGNLTNQELPTSYVGTTVGMNTHKPQ